MADYSNGSGIPASGLRDGDTVTYTTPGFYSLTIPSGEIKLECYGAQGGNFTSGSNVTGGQGGHNYGTFRNTEQNRVIYIGVGGQGKDRTYTIATSGGINGGGNRGYYGTGGGGCSHIALGSVNRQELSNYSEHIDDVVIVAGGGGGGGITYESTPPTNYGAGYGNGADGSGAGTSSSYTYQGINPTGGTLTAGGHGGYVQSIEEYSKGDDGSFGMGGSAYNEDDSHYYDGGGGGGAGYYGGGGSGGMVEYARARGGGGSGYISQNLTDTFAENGVKTGNGKVVITIIKTVSIDGFIKVSDTWKPIVDGFVKVGGLWKAITDLNLKNNGTWKS